MTVSGSVWKSLRRSPFTSFALFLLYLVKRVAQFYWPCSHRKADLLAWVVASSRTVDGVHIKNPCPNQRLHSTASRRFDLVVRF